MFLLLYIAKFGDLQEAILKLVKAGKHNFSNSSTSLMNADMNSSAGMNHGTHIHS